MSRLIRTPLGNRVYQLLSQPLGRVVDGLRREIRSTGADVEARLEAVTEAQHADLQSRLVAFPEQLRREVADEVAIAVPAAFRAEVGELARMLRQQGDASDQVAETLGRTLARLGAEVEVLSHAVERLEARLEAAPVPSGATPTPTSGERARRAPAGPGTGTKRR